MFTEQVQIEKFLSTTKRHIYTIENGRKILLVYDNSKLCRSNPFGGLDYKPLTEVARISFNYDIDGWEVFFR